MKQNKYISQDEFISEIANDTVANIHDINELKQNKYISQDEFISEIANETVANIHEINQLKEKLERIELIAQAKAQLNDYRYKKTVPPSKIKNGYAIIFFLLVIAIILVLLLWRTI